MKRCISFVIALALILGMVAVAQAETEMKQPRWEFDATIDAMVLVDEAELARATCEHSYRMFGSPIRTEYVKISESMHEKRVYYNAVCDKCGKKIELFQSGGMEGHTMVANGDAHVKGKNLHTYNRRCTKCSHTESITIGCPGTGNGDCPLPFSLLIE